MNHIITTAPFWRLDDAAAGPFNAVLLIGVLVFMSPLLIFTVGQSALKSKRRILLSLFVPTAVGLILCAVGGIGMGVSYGNHQAEIASWLHHEYGATVDKDKLTTNTDADVIQTTASIDGGIRVIKLMPTPDGHIAVFGTDDKPLPTR